MMGYGPLTMVLIGLEIKSKERVSDFFIPEGRVEAGGKVDG